MFLSSRGGLWLLHIRGARVNLHLPVPMYVFADLMDSLEDLCAVLLPRFGLPNYATLLRELLEALGAPPGEPLLDVESGNTQVSLTRMFDK